MGGYRIPRRAQLFRVCRSNVQIHAAVDERLLFLPLLRQELCDIPQVGFGGDTLFIVVGIAPLHTALIGSSMENSFLLGRRDLPRGQTQVDATHVSNAPQQCKLVRHRRIAFQRHCCVIPAAEDEVICVELHRRGRDHIQKIFRALDLLRHLLFLLLFLFSHVPYTPLHRNHGIPPW